MSASTTWYVPCGGAHKWGHWRGPAWTWLFTDGPKEQRSAPDCQLLLVLLGPCLLFTLSSRIISFEAQGRLYCYCTPCYQFETLSVLISVSAVFWCWSGDSAHGEASFWVFAGTAKLMCFISVKYIHVPPGKFFTVESSAVTWVMPIDTLCELQCALRESAAAFAAVFVIVRTGGLGAS